MTALQSQSVALEIEGKPYRVPEGLTVIQALWAGGTQTLHEVGCLGGVCGACTITYRLKGGTDVQVALACKTVAVDGMQVAFLSTPAPERPYRIGEGVEPRAELARVLPETHRCKVCSACTMVCPQGIDVMGGVLAAAKGEFATTAEKFVACVMCGACTAVCVGIADIRPQAVGLYARRVEGAGHPRPVALLVRCEEIRTGRYDAEWERTFAELLC